MKVLHRNDDGIASLHALLLVIKHKNAFTFYENPDLRTMVMDLIRDILAMVEDNALSERVLTAFLSFSE